MWCFGLVFGLFRGKELKDACHSANNNNDSLKKKEVGSNNTTMLVEENGKFVWIPALG